MSYMVGCIVHGETQWSYNGLRFATKAEGDQYGIDLYSRWTGLKMWQTHESDDAVNYEIRDNTMRRIE